ncbi:hypothetical protein H5410_002693 [Solanum commersonii]|uniref:Uncharacterized protein n=1 Tax=Solanum commersonii TaxID=4109 RepID=A0A9J6B2V7_SOLCO|nr:hypothetical protein H5410_002693 [Solanum commersonii]
METYFQCKLHGRRAIQVEKFDHVHTIVYENACNFFRWRDREDIDILSNVEIETASEMKGTKQEQEGSTEEDTYPSPSSLF